MRFMVLGSVLGRIAAQAVVFTNLLVGKERTQTSMRFKMGQSVFTL